ncbi:MULTISPECIES: TetR/AcrR family transcriptional regulator [unclassified Microbacterium]|uniref:TetR/AcrR family transcriptional regulator n=1 Tax=unclassified Microbacterium TaxID=2609290 RepID=UPI001DD52A1E|nr:TetR/AcrR family transcriptional regulator [Microbacterium sp. Bi121]CAH0182888.1 hypothetical protein SRABI121_02043 [Microbacterium sp. Bi121]
MARPPLARERVLDAFEAILIDDGERAATLEATAAAAGVSKGGLLYHFGSKDDLAMGMTDRLLRLVDEDLVEMGKASDGPIAYYVRTSVMENDPLDRAIIAVSCLAQGGSTTAKEALRGIHMRWGESIRPHVRDQAAFDLVMLVSDGLYFNNSLGLNGPERPVPRDAALRALVDLVVRAAT